MGKPQQNYKIGTFPALGNVFKNDTLLMFKKIYKDKPRAFNNKLSCFPK